MSEMIERVARRIVATAATLEMHATSEWDLQPELAKEKARVYARAVIEALREPTEAMIDAGNESGDWGPGINCDETDASPEGAWRAMIDEALKP